MTRFQIVIKDEDKVDILINLLKELPFVEIEQSVTENFAIPADTCEDNLEDLFGIWKDRDISLKDIREKAWMRKYDSM